MISRMKWTPGIGPALLAALLFGASTPLAKLLVADISPVLLAGLLYAGSGLGLVAWLLVRGLRPRGAGAEASLQRRDIPWLAGAVLFGGVLGPVLLMVGLASTPASAASLLLNLESVLTALVAWVVFRENVDFRIFLGMVAIVAGGVLYVIASGQAGFDVSKGFASNGYGAHSPGGYSMLSALVIEIVLTMFFLIVILGATDRRAPVGFAPLPIGLALTLIHLISIPVTNTSVNPARSTGVALYVGDWATSQLWLFWLAPIIGALLGALAYRLIAGEKE